MADSLESSSSSAGFNIIQDLDSVTCPICLEVYENPLVIACGHVYCEGCLVSYQKLPEPTCPICRNVFKPVDAKCATKLQTTLMTCSGVCEGCTQTMPLRDLRLHLGVCTLLKQKPTETTLIVSGTSQLIPKDVPNRCTFRCPCCEQQNFDIRGLVEHCSTVHAKLTARVVCPVCSAMPWGNQNQTSADFISHLKLRHRFDYDTLVDFDLDDDAALEKALKASLEEK